MKFNIELADAKEHINTLNLAKKTLEEKVANLNLNISELQKKLRAEEIASSENVQKHDMILAQRTNLLAKIKDLEDKFLKRGKLI